MATKNYQPLHTLSYDVWLSQKTKEMYDQINQSIMQIIQEREQIQQDEQQYRSIPTEGLTAKVLSIGRKIQDRYIDCLASEIPVREQIIKAIEANKADCQKYKQDGIQPEEIEKENAEFLIKNGWIDPESPVGRKRPGYMGYFLTACRNRENWINAAWRQKSGSSVEWQKAIEEQDKHIGKVKEILNSLR